MIVLKLEMWPGGDARRAYTLGRTYIWNNGQTVDPNKGDYGVVVMRKGQEEKHPNELQARVRSGEVTNYPRLSYNVWRLVIRALKSAFPEEG